MSRGILIVEDERDCREGLAELVADAGYEVETAEDGPTALARLQQGPCPALILLDLLLPGMTGWQFMECLQQDADLAAIPIIVLTGGDPLLLPTPPAQMVASFLKPFDFALLLPYLQRYTQREAVTNRSGPEAFHTTGAGMGVALTPITPRQAGAESA